jgi:hypothetical protein
MLSLITEHGRATPLIWLTVDKKTLKDQRNLHEDRLLVRLAEILPPQVKVRIIADRGFGDHKLYRLPTEQLHFDHVIRFRGNITVTAADGETRTAAHGFGRAGRHASFAAPRSPPNATRSAPWSVCVRRTGSRRGAWPPAAPMRRPRI